jgi:hypothetical protein
VADSGMAPAHASEPNVKIVTIAIDTDIDTDTIDLFISFLDLTVKFNLAKRNDHHRPSLSAELGNAMVNWFG